MSRLRRESDEVWAVRRVLMQAVLPLIAVALHVVPLMLAGWMAFQLRWSIPLALVVGALGYLTSFPILAGVLSRAGTFAVVEGRIPRDLGHRIYAWRRVHGICWTSLYYHPPVYALVLAIPPLRNVVLRLFGYRGQLRFTIYPDVWVRDWPLIDIGEDAYIANKATISPNMALADGTLVVAPVSVGARVLVGHGALIAPGTMLGDRARVGTGASVGFGTRVGTGASIGDIAGLDHHVRVGAAASVGNAARIVARGMLADGELLDACEIKRGRRTSPAATTS